MPQVSSHEGISVSKIERDTNSNIRQCSNSQKRGKTVREESGAAMAMAESIKWGRHRAQHSSDSVFCGRLCCSSDRLRTRTRRTSVLPKIEHVEWMVGRVFFLLTHGEASHLWATASICVARGHALAKKFHAHVAVSLHLGKDECLTFLERIEFLLYRDGRKVIA